MVKLGEKFLARPADWGLGKWDYRTAGRSVSCEIIGFDHRLMYVLVDELSNGNGL